MRVFAIVAVFVIIFSLAGFALYKFLLPLRPPAKDIRQSLPQNSEMGSPLKLPSGTKIGVFADLKGDSPRVLAFSPTGVLHATLTSKGKVVALPDDNHDGKADRVAEVLTGLDKPHGLAFDGGYLYVAETDKVVRYLYDSANLSASNPEVLFNLSGGGEHFTRTIRIYGGKLYVSIGSSCNVCLEKDSGRASIWVSDLDGKNLKLFARGLRNTVFFAFDKEGVMWGPDMGRDYLGDSLPPDEINKISEGKDYGWPYCFGNKVRDSKFEPGSNMTYCTGTEAPAFNLPAHAAPLGLAFDSHGDLLVALHGSWNSSVPVGYKVVKLAVFGGEVSGMEDYITGWLNKSEVLGRPVDLAFGGDGTLYISDDKANVIYALAQ